MRKKEESLKFVSSANIIEFEKKNEKKEIISNFLSYIVVNKEKRKKNY